MKLKWNLDLDLLIIDDDDGEWKVAAVFKCQAFNCVWCGWNNEPWLQIVRGMSGLSQAVPTLDLSFAQDRWDL